jgi:hypothetical protein
MPIDLFNESRDETLELLPAGIYRVQAEIIPGGYGDDDVLKKSKKGTLAYLNLRNTVIEGPHKGAVVYDMVMVETIGDQPTDGDQRTVRRGRTRVRRIVESARGVDVDTETPENIREKISISNWGDIHGLCYYAEIDTEEGDGTYKPKNIIKSIITPTDKDWPGTPATPAAPVRPIEIAKPGPRDLGDSIPF